MIAYAKGLLTIVLYDVLGKEVLKGNMSSHKKQEIGSERLREGIYFITLVKDNKTVAKQKLLIIK